MALPKSTTTPTPSNRRNRCCCRADCLCAELARRRAYDAVRARKGLIALYRPPSMR